MDIEFVRSRFIKHFDGSTGSVYASPGRINLIGEHTDGKESQFRLTGLSCHPAQVRRRLDDFARCTEQCSHLARKRDLAAAKQTDLPDEMPSGRLLQGRRNYSWV